MMDLRSRLLLSDVLCTLDRITSDIEQVIRDLTELAEAPTDTVPTDLRGPLAIAAALRKTIGRECDR